jgi:hypothetical protein
VPFAPIRHQIDVSSRPHCTASSLCLELAIAFQSESPSAKPHRCKEYKNITIEASMLLKTKKGVGKRTQNEPKNKADFECPMHTWNDGAE